ncbi:MAG TPA: hypothetical protein VMR95_02480 [Candidatus Binatia bacterium]|nr:hypothetical protein [Candidatus Binatia bacterium]
MSENSHGAPRFSKVKVLLQSRRFYLFVLGLFVFESIWIAFSAVYPQAFDENFHFGLIQVYSHYWLPFLGHQPPNANAYGAVARDPSYLYHYLMSFPYRLLALFIHRQTAMVIIFRLFDVGLFMIGLQLFRKVLLRVGVSRALTNLSLFLFVLIPIVPQLAAQVSYDDLLFPLVAWICLLAFKAIDELRSKHPSFQTLAVLLSVSILSCLVTYIALPLLFGAALALVVVAIRSYGYDLKSFWRGLCKDFRARSRYLKIGLISLLLLSVGLFIQRDGVNLIEYHSIVPNCSKVLSVKQCSAYSAWYSDYTRHQQVVTGSTVASVNIFLYTYLWLYWMWYRLFFAVNGPASGFYSTPPFLLPSIAAALLAISGVIVMIKWRKRIFSNNPYLLFLLAVCSIYILSLFVKGFATYKYTATLENMNGRYLLPVLLPIAAMAGLAFSIALKRLQVQKALFAVIISVLFLQGGGLLTFILSSDQSWYWPNNTVVKVNNTAKRIANHVIVKHTIPVKTSS